MIVNTYMYIVNTYISQDGMVYSYTYEQYIHNFFVGDEYIVKFTPLNSRYALCIVHHALHVHVYTVGHS